MKLKLVRTHLPMEEDKPSMVFETHAKVILLFTFSLVWGQQLHALVALGLGFLHFPSS